jgi:hypothetical protein
MPETPPRASPFDKAILNITEGFWTGLGGLIPAYTSKIHEKLVRRRNLII